MDLAELTVPFPQVVALLAMKDAKYALDDRKESTSPDLYDAVVPLFEVLGFAVQELVAGGGYRRVKEGSVLSLLITSNDIVAGAPQLSTLLENGLFDDDAAEGPAALWSAVFESLEKDDGKGAGVAATATLPKDAAQMLDEMSKNGFHDFMPMIVSLASQRTFEDRDQVGGVTFVIPFPIGMIRDASEAAGEADLPAEMMTQEDHAERKTLH